MVSQTLARNIEDDTGMVNWYCFFNNPNKKNTILLEPLCVAYGRQIPILFLTGTCFTTIPTIFFYHPGHWDGKPKMWDNHPNNPALDTGLYL